MKRRFHELRVSSFVQATEVEDRVVVAMMNAAGPFDPTSLQRAHAEGMHHNPIIILTLCLTRERDILARLERWKKEPFWDESLRDADERLDEDLVYHIRLDKQEAYKGRLVLWTSGEVIEIRLKVATYPSSRSEALKVLREGA